jgi:hypothetical protein
MWPRLQSLFNRINQSLFNRSNKDPKLEELLERNKKALDKKRQEAGLPSYRAHSARKNPTKPGRR